MTDINEFVPQVETARWFMEAQQRLREARQTNDPRTIAAAESAFEEVKAAIRQTQRVH